MGRCAYYYDPDVGNFYYAQGHPMKPHRMRMTHNLLVAYGMVDKMDVLLPPRASERDMTRFHADEYISFLKTVTPENAMEHHQALSRFNVFEDCPVFDGLWEYCQIAAGGSLGGAARLNSGEASVALNWAGGLHHAKKAEASGFCYINDCVLAILELLKVHSRVLYVDIDIHHGDGVEEAFYSTDRVMTASFHKFGGFFPGTGAVDDVGSGRGKNYAVNFPLRDGIDDESYREIFIPVMRRIMEWYAPGAVVLQCGADSLSGDRLGCFNLSLRGHAQCVDFFKSYDVPLLLLGGGGYTIRNVARCWAYETSRVLGVDLADSLPFNDNLEFYAPEYRLHITPSNMENHNTMAELEAIKARILDHLRGLPAAPSVPYMDVPRTSPLGVHVNDNDSDAEDPDTRHHSRRAKSIVEYEDSDDELGDDEILGNLPSARHRLKRSAGFSSGIRRRIRRPYVVTREKNLHSPPRADVHQKVSTPFSEQGLNDLALKHRPTSILVDTAPPSFYSKLQDGGIHGEVTAVPPSVSVAQERSTYATTRPTEELTDVVRDSFLSETKPSFKTGNSQAAAFTDGHASGASENLRKPDTSHNRPKSSAERDSSDRVQSADSDTVAQDPPVVGNIAQFEAQSTDAPVTHPRVDDSYHTAHYDPTDQRAHQSGDWQHDHATEVGDRKENGTLPTDEAEESQTSSGNRLNRSKDVPKANREVSLVDDAPVVPSAEVTGISDSRLARSGQSRGQNRTAMESERMKDTEEDENDHSLGTSSMQAKQNEAANPGEDCTGTELGRQDIPESRSDSTGTENEASSAREIDEAKSREPDDAVHWRVVQEEDQHSGKEITSPLATAKSYDTSAKEPEFNRREPKKRSSEGSALDVRSRALGRMRLDESPKDASSTASDGAALTVKDQHRDEQVGDERHRAGVHESLSDRRPFAEENLSQGEVGGSSSVSVDRADKLDDQLGKNATERQNDTPKNTQSRIANTSRRFSAVPGSDSSETSPTHPSEQPLKPTNSHMAHKSDNDISDPSSTFHPLRSSTGPGYEHGPSKRRRMSESGVESSPPSEKRNSSNREDGFNESRNTSSSSAMNDDIDPQENSDASAPSSLSRTKSDWYSQSRQNGEKYISEGGHSRHGIDDSKCSKEGLDDPNAGHKHLRDRLSNDGNPVGSVSDEGDQSRTKSDQRTVGKVTIKLPASGKPSVSKTGGTSLIETARPVNHS